MTLHLQVSVNVSGKPELNPEIKDPRSLYICETLDMCQMPSRFGILSLGFQNEKMY